MTITELEPTVEKIDDKERWLPVVGLEGKYEISSMGRIYSRIHCKLLKPYLMRPPRRPVRPGPVGARVSA